MAKAKLSELQNLVANFIEQVDCGQIKFNCQESKECLRELAIGAGFTPDELPSELALKTAISLNVNIDDYNGSDDDVYNLDEKTKCTVIMNGVSYTGKIQSAEIQDSYMF